MRASRRSLAAQIGTPLSPCRRMCTICSGVNLLVRIVPAPSLVGTGSRLFTRVAVAQGSGSRPERSLTGPNEYAVLVSVSG